MRCFRFWSSVFTRVTLSGTKGHFCWVELVLLKSLFTQWSLFMISFLSVIEVENERTHVTLKDYIIGAGSERPNKNEAFCLGLLVPLPKIPQAKHMRPLRSICEWTGQPGHWSADVAVNVWPHSLFRVHRPPAETFPLLTRAPLPASSLPVSPILKGLEGVTDEHQLLWSAENSSWGLLQVMWPDTGLHLKKPPHLWN